MASIDPGDPCLIGVAVGDRLARGDAAPLLASTRPFSVPWRWPALVVLLAIVWPLPGRTAEQFRADDWRTECDAARGGSCSIMVPFQQRGSRGASGSFVLAVDIQTGVIAIVGQPSPLAGRLQIDKNSAIRCHGPRHCLFNPRDSAAAAAELAVGSIALVDVDTRDGAFHASVSAKGYRAGLAKIRAWSYPPLRAARRR